MKILMILLVIAVVALADETDEEPKPVSNEIGITIAHCHPGDPAQIQVIPIPENDVRRGGWFETTNTVLTLKDLSMLPSGLNRLNIASLCRGLTGEVRSVVIDLKRPPPAPRVASRRVRIVNTNSPVPLRAGQDTNSAPPLPPLPPGFAGAVPLPNAETNKVEYKDLELMRRYYSRTRRN